MATFTVRLKPGEELRPIEGFERIPGKCVGYWVSSLGRVFSGRGEGHFLTLSPMERGYLRVHLKRGGRDYTRKVHVLVANAFLGNRPPGMEIDHISRNKLDNRVQNLRHISKKQNLYRSLGSTRNPRAAFTADQVSEVRGRAAQGWVTYQQLADEFGVRQGTIADLVNRRTYKDVV